MISQLKNSLPSLHYKVPFYLNPRSTRLHQIARQYYWLIYEFAYMRRQL